MFLVFTLGMFTKIANQWGVILAHLTGMGIAMWAQFGRPRPPAPVLGFSIEDCSAFEGKLSLTNMTIPISSIDRSFTSDAEQTYFYLYRVSYMYGVIIGFLVTLILGYVFSYIFYLLKWQTMEKIYVEGSIGELNADLFVPPIAKRIKRKINENRVKQ